MNLATLQFLATAFIAIFAATIAYNQWIVARNKLRLELFDRRYKIYSATRNFLIAVQQTARLEDKVLYEFYSEVSDAVFFFRKDTVDYIYSLSRSAIDMSTSAKLYQRLDPSDPKRFALIEKEHKQLLFLNEQYKALPKKFSSYLDFSDINLDPFIKQIEASARHERPTELL